MSTPNNQLPNQQPAGLSSTEIENMVRNFMEKGETSSKVATLLTENFQYREKIRQLSEQITGLQAKVPAEGSLVLTGDDVKLHNDFIALNLKPAEITTLQTEKKALEERVVKAERDKSIDDGAKAEGYDPVVLATLIGDKTLITKPVDEDVDGEKKKVDRAFIVTVDPTSKVQTEERLSEYITKNHAKFLPSLMAESEDAEAAGGTPFPRQRASTGGGKPAKTDASKAYINSRYKPPPAQGAAK